MKQKFILSLLIASLFVINIQSQTPDDKWGVGVYGGFEQYHGDLGTNFYKFGDYFNAFGGISVARNLSEHFDIEFTSSLGDITYKETDLNQFSARMFQFNLNAKYNFFKYDEVKFRPFVFAGLGYVHFKDYYDYDPKSGMQIPDFGFGVTYKVSPKVSVVLKETFMYTDKDWVDHESGNENDMFLQHSIGVVFNFGKAADTDGDGVSNRHDLCPDLAGVLVFQGCPDSDGDGVKDSEDLCPESAGPLNGCPDADGDGVADKDDKCPNSAGGLSGCPDADGDGVADKDDLCPESAGPLNGCPDADGDGVADKDDLCPNSAGPLNGCPDTDGDGVADKDDHCPEVAGILANKGCPEVKVEEKELLKEALHGVKYQSGKAIITHSSYAILDNIVEMMKNNPNYNIRIEGHSDSQGDDAMNMQLSKDRAHAVEKYLLDAGISEDRISADGFGETQPVADNATSNGRAENRRVEITIEF